VRATHGVTAVAAVAVLLAGCAGDDPEPQAIEPTAEPTPDETAPVEEPTEEADPYAVPDEIDVAYVQSVVDVVVPLLEDPLRDALTSAPHDLPPDPLRQVIQATHSPDASAALLAAYAGILSDAEVAQEQLAALDGAPSGWDVREVAVERDGCLVVGFDYRSGEGGAGGAYAVLLQGYEDRDPQGVNPTPWVVDRTNFAENTTPDELAARCDVDQTGDGDQDDPEAGGEA
jgi:hypothetical protein